MGTIESKNTAPRQRVIRVQSSRMENGIEICNTCGHSADKPYRYKLVNGRERGCIASCHDKFIAVNTRPNWREPRMVLPQWVTKARRDWENSTRRKFETLPA